MNKIIIDKEFENIVNTYLLNAHDNNTLYDTIAKIYIEKLNVKNFTIFLLDANDNNYYIEFSTFSLLKSSMNKLFPLFNNRFLRRMYAAGTFKLNTHQHEKDYFVIDGNTLDIASGIPLYYKSRIIGFTVFHEKFDFTENELKQITYLNNKTAEEIIVLKRLEDAHETIFKSKEIINLLKYLNSLFKETDLDKVLYIVLNNMFIILEAEAGCIGKVEKKNWLTPVELGINNEILNSIVFKDGMSVVDFAKNLKQILTLNREEIADQIDLSSLSVNITSLIAIPIVIDNECDTVVLLANLRKEITDEDILFIQKLSDISSIAVRNNKIHTAKKMTLRKQVDNLTALKETLFHTLDSILSEFEAS